MLNATVSQLCDELGVSKEARKKWRQRGMPDAMKWRVLRLAQNRGLNVTPDMLDEKPVASQASPEPAREAA